MSAKVGFGFVYFFFSSSSCLIVGMVCRDKTFNFFALVGSVCPPCPKEGYQGKQWTKDELKKADLLTRFYVDPRTEYVWCAAHGIPSCFKEKNKAKCESR